MIKKEAFEINKPSIYLKIAIILAAPLIGLIISCLNQWDNLVLATAITIGCIIVILLIYMLSEDEWLDTESHYLTIKDVVENGGYTVIEDHGRFYAGIKIGKDYHAVRYVKYMLDDNNNIWYDDNIDIEFDSYLWRIKRKWCNAVNKLALQEFMRNYEEEYKAVLLRKKENEEKKKSGYEGFVKMEGK